MNKMVVVIALIAGLGLSQSRAQPPVGQRDADQRGTDISMPPPQEVMVNFNSPYDPATSYLVAFFDATLGMPGPTTETVWYLGTPTTYTMTLQASISNGPSATIPVQSVDSGILPETFDSTDQIDLALLNEFQAQLAGLGIDDPENRIATPGIQCQTIKRVKICYAELPDGRIMITAFWFNGHTWHKIIDTGWIDPQNPPWAFTDQSEAIRDFLNQYGDVIAASPAWQAFVGTPAWQELQRSRMFDGTPLQQP